MNDSRILRDRMAAADAAFDALPIGGDAGSPAILVQTTQETTYPTVAQAMYAALPCEVSGKQAEGQTATYLADSSTLIYVFNDGTAIPPQGTTLVASFVGGRWVMEYNG